MNKIFQLILLLFFISCNQVDKPIDNQEVSELEQIGFEEFKSVFVEDLWKLNPIWASYEGYHKYDSIIPIPNKVFAKQKLNFSQQYLEKLKNYDPNSLEIKDRIDYYLIDNYLKSLRFYINELKENEWNPSNYNLGGAFFQVLNYKEASLNDRLLSIDKKMDFISDYYAQAKKNLKKPTLVHTQLAISQLEGAKSIFSKNILDSLSTSTLDEATMLRIKQKVESSIQAIEEFRNYLESKVLASLDENDQSFRIGKDLFEKKFKFEIQSEFTADQIFKAAIEEKEKLHDNLYKLSGMLWEKYFGNQEKPGNRLSQISMVINEVSKQHVESDSLISEIKRQIPLLKSFVQEKNLITLDPKKALVVRETPKYMRGVAGASISAPGPYDKYADTYYNVTPLDDYTAEEAESYLREYNDFTLQILNIHEAVPGHYTQLIYSNESSSIIKSILGNGAMVEGWAVYAEKMMLENDFGGDFLEMGLMYYKWNLRTVCNTILDYGVHVLDFSEEDVMQLLVKEAFQEKTEAEGKWKRAKISQVQLCSYFTGYYEILLLREEYIQMKKDDYSLKEFHEEFLSFGSAPVKYINEIMIEPIHSEPTNEN